VRAALERYGLGLPWDISYTYCYDLSPVSLDVANMTIRRLDYTAIGAAGEVYHSAPDLRYVGQAVGLRRAECLDPYRDQNITRAVASTYRLTFEYGADDGSRPFVQSVTGNISSAVPPLPFITAATLTDDIKETQRILRQLRPVTFTITNVEGGTPPFLYKWWLDGFVLRDWDPNATFVWDGATVAGRPLASGSYTMAVGVRRSTWSEQETGASVDFLILL
jgi:hypothetical protein